MFLLGDFEPSFHVLIATIGKPSLFTMLDSLRNQLEKQDYLTIVYDAEDEGDTLDELPEHLQSFQCQCTVIMEPENLGFWGHGIRNKHNVLAGDFILHADDDDVYFPDAFSTLREECTDPSTLYFFSMIGLDGTVHTAKPFRYGNVSTQMGVIPQAYNSRATWANRYGGDFDFYKQLIQLIPQKKFIKKVLYQARPGVNE